MNDSEHELKGDRAPCGGHSAGSDDSSAAPMDVPRRGMDDLNSTAVDRIHTFMAESTVRGGASPADVADLYTSQEIVDDGDATEYLDRRFVHGEVLADWRAFQDRLSEAYLDGKPGASAETLLDRVHHDDNRQRTQRSIFDDPDDDDEQLDDEQSERIEDRDPRLADLSEDARRAIERYIISDVLCYGVAPYKVMELRETLRSTGDERALQYLDLPFELGGRPGDWDGLRDHALMVRAHLESYGVDPSEAFAQTEMSHPLAEAAELLGLLEERDLRR